MEQKTKEIKTVCDKCARVLTDDTGRQQVAHFDSSLTKLHQNTDEITYAHCDGCYYVEKMKLPEGKTCADCVHLKRCVGLGCTKPENTSCDFFPNKFREVTR